MNSDGIYYPFEVLIAFNKKGIKLQSVINYITIHCHNTSKRIRIKILVTSSGNIRNQFVYVANQNKTFERHVQVSSFIWETPMLFSIRLYFYVQSQNLTIYSKIDQSTIIENISLWEGVFGILDMSIYITLYLLALIGVKVHWLLKTMECHHIY